MGVLFFDRVEYIAGIEDNDRYEQFILFLQSFQKLSVVDGSSMGYRVNLVQIFRRIHAYLSFHIYLSDILHFSFLMHVTSKRGPYSFM